MSTSKSIFDSSPDEATQADYDRYREMCVLSVVSLVTGLLSLLSFIFPVLLFLPTLGALCGMFALRSIRQRPNELIGSGLAKVGLALSLVCLIAGTATAATIYLTEVPEGFERIHFSQLQPNPDHPQLPVPPFAIERNEKQVFIKGYIYPSDRKSDLSRFVLVPDMGTCCFGGDPKLTDMIEVTLEEPLRTNWSTRVRRLAGTLLVDTRIKPVSGLKGVYYRLKVDHMDGQKAAKVNE